MYCKSEGTTGWGLMHYCFCLASTSTNYYLSCFLHAIWMLRAKCQSNIPNTAPGLWGPVGRNRGCLTRGRQSVKPCFVKRALVVRYAFILSTTRVTGWWFLLQKLFFFTILFTAICNMLIYLCHCSGYSRIFFHDALFGRLPPSVWRCGRLLEAFFFWPFP